MAGSIFEQFMKGRNLAQQQALNQLEMAQQQQMFPIEQQLKQLDIQRQQQMFPIEQQLKQLELQSQQQQLEAGRQDIAERDRQNEIAHTTVVGRIAEQVKARNIQDPQERLKFTQGLMTRAGYEGVISLEDVSDEALGDAIAAKDVLTQGDSGKFNIGSRTIKADGTVVASTDQGPIVWDPSGKMLKGEEASRQIRSANEYETRLQKDRSFGRGIGAQSVELSGKAFEQLPKIRMNIGNLNEAIDLLDRGAKTGPIYSLLPSVSDAAVELDNLQAQLGLDVIGNTTFGALSESELKLALNTALPKNLKQDALRDWLVKKRDAQNKLASYIQDAAQFFGRGGNISDFLELQKNAQASGVSQEQRVETSADQVAPQISEGAIIRNPTTGQQKQLVNGQWVDI